MRYEKFGENFVLVEKISEMKMRYKIFGKNFIRGKKFLSRKCEKIKRKFYAWRKNF